MYMKIINNNLINHFEKYMGINNIIFSWVLCEFILKYKYLIQNSNTYLLINTFVMIIITRNHILINGHQNWRIPSKILYYYK